MVEEISVEELKAQVDAGTAPLVIDVREGWELDISRLDFARHLPMGEVGARMAELDPQTPLVVMCRSGGRSMQVCLVSRKAWISVSEQLGRWNSRLG